MTDDVLSRAFRRYLDVSKVSRRAVSSAPGPMYHRKRFGRRNLADLNSYQSLGSLPAWALPNTPDLSNWQWQPPKPDFWLASPPPPPPQPRSQEVRTFRRPLAIQFEAGNKSLAWSGLRRELRDLHSEHFRTAAAYRAGFKRWNQRFADLISRGDISGPATAELFMAALRHIQIACRIFPESQGLFGDHISAVAEGILSAQEKDASFCIPSPKFWELFSQRLEHLEITPSNTKYFTLAMQNTHSRHGRRALELAYSHLERYFVLWRGADVHGHPNNWPAAEISELSRLAHMWSGRVKNLLSETRSCLDRGHIQMARINLTRAKKCAKKMEGFVLKEAALMSDDWQLAEALAGALAQKDPKQHKVLFRQATTLVGKSEGWSRAQYNWLQVLARLPKIRTPQFKRLLDLAPARGQAALSHTELCNLLLLHWSSQGLLRNSSETRRRWMEMQGEKSDQALAALALAVNGTTTPKQCTAIFWNLWDIMQIRAGKKTLLRQLAWLSKRQECSPGFWQRLAWTSNDSRIALLIHHTMTRKMDKNGKLHSFWWPFWSKYVSKLSRQWKWPPVDPILISNHFIGPSLQESRAQPAVDSQIQGLEQDYRQRLQAVEQETSDEQLASYRLETSDHKDKERDSQLQRVRTVLELLRHSRQITDRQALHYVTIFTSVLANKQGFLSARDLATLTSVVMRTLNQGKMGSLQRLRWYLQVIHRHLGKEACVKVGMILKGRRQANWRLWQMRLSIINRRLHQKREAALSLGQCQRQRGDKLVRLWKAYVYDNRHRTMKRRRMVRREQRSSHDSTAIERDYVRAAAG